MNKSSYIISDKYLTFEYYNTRKEKQAYLDEIGKQQLKISKKVKRFKNWASPKIKKFLHWYLTNFYLNLVGSGFGIFGFVKALLI